MIYTWFPSSTELVWSSYVNTIQLSMESEREPDVEIFRSLLQQHVDDISNSLFSDIPSDCIATIAFSNEKAHTMTFFSRVINQFPQGWSLNISF